MRSLSFSNVAVRAMTGALALGAALSTVACNADRATGAVDAAPGAPTLARGAVLSTTITANALTRSKALANDVSYSAEIGGNGGRIDIPEAGFSVIIPNGAFPGEKPIKFTVTAVAGSAVAYRFSPHGMKFTKPLNATQDLSVTTYSSTTGDLESGYFATDTDLNTKTNSANVSEVFPGNVQTNGGPKMHYSIPHFSGYVIVTGRSDF